MSDTLSSMTDSTQPTHAGQAVRDIRNGKIGITTDSPAARTPTIPVMFLGGPYPVRCQIAELERVSLNV